MDHIRPADGAGNAAPIYPSAVYSSFDYIKVWLPRPLSGDKMQWLRARCGKLPPPYVNRSGWQRLKLYQPRCEALQFLASINGAHLNLVEVALDWVFSCEADLDEAVAFLRHHIVKSYHRGEIRFYPEDIGHTDNSDFAVMNSDRRANTRYSNSRKSATNFVDYPDRPSKVSGELHCLHIEWRIQRASALVRAGLPKVADLLTLDHREFWREQLQLRMFDFGKLGRTVRNTQLDSRRRQAWINRFGLDVDWRYGAMILRAYGSVQAVLNSPLADRAKLRSCLLPQIDVSHLLPHPHGDDFFVGDYASFRVLRVQSVDFTTKTMRSLRTILHAD
jgi:hypothetical protein